MGTYNYAIPYKAADSCNDSLKMICYSTYDLSLHCICNARDTQSKKLDATCRLRSWLKKVGCDIR